ncbi:MAG: peroxiredoxin [Acidobacteriota bacterium]|nr:peroxiredoxin [Acidobacteriota bacterium]
MDLQRLIADKRMLWGAGAAVLLFGSLFARGSSEVPQVGQTAPDFTLPSQDGSAVALNGFRGKWVVLYFYPKDNTPACAIEAHNFQRDLSKYEQSNAVIVGVSVDSSDSHKNFCAKQGLHFKLLADTGKKVVERYGSLRNYMGFKIAARNTFLIDPEGKIVKVWTGVSASHHSEEILAELRQVEKKS